MRRYVVLTLFAVLLLVSASFVFKVQAKDFFKNDKISNESLQKGSRLLEGKTIVIDPGRIQTQDFQSKASTAIVEGILEYFQGQS